MINERLVLKRTSLFIYKKGRVSETGLKQKHF